MGLPYFNMYVRDFESDTSHLTIEEDGAYNRLLRLQWRLGGQIPADETILRRYLRCSKAEFKRSVLPVIEEFFVQEDDVLYNRRLRKEFEISENSHKKRVEAGRKGGEKKSANAMKTNKTTPINAKAKLKQPEPEPEIKKEDTIVSSKKEKKRATQIPSEWVDDPENLLSTENLKFSQQKGMTHATAKHEAQKFVNHAISNKRTQSDWYATWRTWCGNWVTFGSRQVGAGAPGSYGGQEGRRSCTIADAREKRRRQNSMGNDWSHSGNENLSNRAQIINGEFEVVKDVGR